MDMMSNNSDYVNNLLNQLAYVNIGENFEPGDNLIEVLRNADTATASSLAIRDYENHNDTNGFAAIAIEDPATGDVGISYRGTENLLNIRSAVQSALSGDSEAVRSAINNQIDMIDNGSTAITGDSIQAQEARDFFERNQSTNGNNYLYGHSKGGELAMQVYVDNYDRIAEAHIINPQPINWASLTLDQLQALRNGKVDAVVINGDLVWMLGGIPYPVRIVQNNGTDSRFFGPHSLSSAYYDPNTGAANTVTIPYTDYPLQGLLGLGLKSLLMTAQVGYQHTRIMLNWIDDAHRFFTEDLPEYGRRFHESVVNAWEEAKSLIKDRALDFLDDFDALIGKYIPHWDPSIGRIDWRRFIPLSSADPCQFQTDTQRLHQAASQLQNVARQLDRLEDTLGSYVRSFHRLTFTGTVAIKASLLSLQVKTGQLCGDASEMASALSEIASLYEQTESRIRNNAHL